MQISKIKSYTGGIPYYSQLVCYKIELFGNFEQLNPYQVPLPQRYAYTLIPNPIHYSQYIHT